MSKNNGNGKQLRFASLIRVSTEQQEKVGESLSTQRSSNERDVKRLEGHIVERYGGQEHATAGWEKKEVDRLIGDASKGKWDAIIVNTPDRWSRDNGKSKEGLQVFRDHGIRFFVGSTEWNLFDPQHRFFLGMSAEVGEFIALQQAKKSFESRIERAKNDGAPTCGKSPFGREWDKDNKTWSVIPEKQEAIADIARRYLAGEGLKKLTDEYHISYANVYKVLKDQCGEEWSFEFGSETLNIRETVTVKVPRLLPEPIIKAVCQRLDANRTYRHGTPKHDYLLNGLVFCGVCGHNLTGQPNHEGRIYSHGRQESPTTPPRSGVVAGCPLACPSWDCYGTDFGNRGS